MKEKAYDLEVKFIRGIERLVKKYESLGSIRIAGLMTIALHGMMFEAYKGAEQNENTKKRP